MKEDILVGNTLTLANIFVLIDKTTQKVGLEFLAPLEETVRDEKISKAIKSQADDVKWSQESN